MFGAFALYGPVRNCLLQDNEIDPRTQKCFLREEKVRKRQKQTQQKTHIYFTLYGNFVLFMSLRKDLSS